VTRPSPQDGSANYFPNYNGEAPTMRLRSPYTPAEPEAPPQNMPMRIAYAGYADPHGTRVFFKDELDDIWKDTLTFEVWDGQHC
jgi:hypothetical protein